MENSVLRGCDQDAAQSIPTIFDSHKRIRHWLFKLCENRRGGAAYALCILKESEWKVRMNFSSHCLIRNEF